jgi:hypothetical protein
MSVDTMVATSDSNVSVLWTTNIDREGVPRPPQSAKLFDVRHPPSLLTAIIMEGATTALQQQVPLALNQPYTATLHE